VIGEPRISNTAVRRPSRAFLRALLATAVLLVGGEAAAQPALAPSAAQASAPAPSPASGADAVDPEFTRPLTPLDSFTLEAQQPSGPPPPPAPRVTYTLRVEGLDAVGLTSRFHALSSLQQNRGKATNVAQIRARAAEDVELAERLLHSEGYYDGRADLTVGLPPDANGRVAVTITVTPGPRYALGRIQVTGPETRPPGLARSALTLQPGQPIVAPEVAAAEANVRLRLPEQGYPFVQLGQRDIVLDDASRTGDYTLPVDPGRRSSFGGIRVAGKPVFKPGHIAVISRARPGQLYDNRKVDDLRRALVATSIYSTVGIEPVDTGLAAPDGTERVDLKVTGTPAPPRTLSGTLGYETGLGATLTGTWSHRNLFPPEGALVLNGVAGTSQQLVGITFRRSNAGQRDRTFDATAQISRDDLNAYQAYTTGLSARLSRASTPLWQKRWTYSIGAEAEVTSEQAFDFSAGQRVRRTYEVVALPGQLTYDRSDSLLDPSRGYRLTIRPSPEVSLGHGTQPYFKGIVEGTAYAPLGKAFVLAGRLRVGGLFGAGAQEIAPSRRFYAGGGGSVRGYGYQELGPKDPQNKPVGGASLTEFSVEGRYRFGNLGLVGFLDGGQVYESSTPTFQGLRYGAGVGARLYTAFGPLRLDIATPIAPRRGDPVVAIYISIGQAF
jgi:translocation and assembly module TamA